MDDVFCLRRVPYQPGNPLPEYCAEALAARTNEPVGMCCGCRVSVKVYRLHLRYRDIEQADKLPWCKRDFRLACESHRISLAGTDDRNPPESTLRVVAV
ncbi:TPA: hypothetical protein ACHGD4_005579, partial [Escherichia coli]